MHGRANPTTVLARTETRDGPVSITPRELQELNEFSKKDPQTRYLELSAIKNLASITFGESELEIDATEAINAKYYRGRVASWHDSKQIYSWESWPE